MSALRYNPADRSYKLCIGKTKTSRRSTVEVTYRWRKGICAAKLLPMYLALFGVDKHVDRAQEGQPLFPGVLQGAWRGLIKEIAKALDLDPALYSGHSFRAGWATDMFNSGVPYYAIKKVGRWESDAALLYYRDDEGARDIIQRAQDKLHDSLQRRAIVGGV